MGCTLNTGIDAEQTEATTCRPCGPGNKLEPDSWKYLKLDYRNRYILKGKRKGQPYTGRTAEGHDLLAVHPGLFSIDSPEQPWMILAGTTGFPWLFLPRKLPLQPIHIILNSVPKFISPNLGVGVGRRLQWRHQGPETARFFPYQTLQIEKWGRRHVEVKIIRKYGEPIH